VLLLAQLVLQFGRHSKHSIHKLLLLLRKSNKPLPLHQLVLMKL
jgi:hypothetical protein